MMEIDGKKIITGIILFIIISAIGVSAKSIFDVAILKSEYGRIISNQITMKKDIKALLERVK